MLRVLCFLVGHQSVHQGSADSLCLCLNYNEILHILSRYSACVLCYLAGHDHEGGNCVDSSGILHVTFPGTVESSESDAYATAYLYNNRLAIKGKGSYSCSFETKLRFPI